MSSQTTPLASAFGWGRNSSRVRAGEASPAIQSLMVVLGCCLVIGGLVYFAETEPLFKIESVEFTAPDLVAGLIVVVAVFWGLWNGFQFPPKIIVIPFACFFVATALSVLAADEKLRPAAALIQMVEFGSFAWGISLLTSHRRVLRVVHFILGIFVLETVIAAWQFAAGSDLDPNNPLRVYPHGTFSSQMKYGEFCAVSAAVAYALSISTPKKSARLVYVVTMLVLLFGAVIAHERAPWIAFLASGIITTFLSSRGKKRRILMMRFAAGILCVVLAVVSIPSLRESLISRIAEAQSQDVGTNTLLSRLMVWGLAWQFFQSHPVLGIGPKNFTLFSPQFLDLEETGWIEGADAHNIWLQTLAEGGVIGFITYLPLCFGILALAYSRLRDSQWADVRPFLLAYLAYHCFMMILSNAYFVKAEGHMHYLMIGLMLGVIRGKIGLGDKIDGTAGSLVSC